MKETSIPALEKKILAASFVFIAAMLGLIAYSVYSLGLAVPTCATLKPFDKGEIIPHPPGRYEVHVLAEMWDFDPKRVVVPKGSVVDFYVTSADVTHGFRVDGTNVNLMAVPNVVNYAQARFDRPGKYVFLCHEYCGVNHQRMSGLVEVVDSTDTAR